ncbi:MAG: Nitroreductase family protein [Candidatus Atribacteria bacterium ADurb.Bin276]|uniref:Nitroreductase family protein n=1 Tax=Candidatus Atribacter allofermentans TaxID=1852833 RepID=A0A1V5SMU1_9BACT|nr:MAG: Nitroreductase family protein [Candidatus Atribacteria bacterium ADurb.Bin276]
MVYPRTKLISFVWIISLMALLVMFMSFLANGNELVTLPQIEYNDNDLISAIIERKAERQYATEPVALKDLALVLWAGSGIKSPQVDSVSHATRTIPSAMGIYPIDVYVFALQVENLPSNIYLYLPEKHALQEIPSVNVTEALTKITNQRAVQNASMVFLIVFHRDKSSRMNDKFAYFEAGEVVQNISLMAVDRGLGSYVIGMYYQEKIIEVLNEENIEPVVLMAVGKPSQ